LPPGQRQLLDRIHLPDVVGVPRGVPLLGGLAAGGCRRRLGQTPPALEGAFAGKGKARVELRQTDADKAGAPSRVGLVQEEGFLDQGIARRQGPLRGSILRGG
jgi:hypothetical protein